MRIRSVVAGLALFAAAPASAEVLYARPDVIDPAARYGWGDQIVVDSLPLKAAIAVAKAANGTRALEIRLLHALDTRETLYTVDLGRLRSALRWAGSENAKLVIRGQLATSEPSARALTILVGRSLTETICQVAGADVCTSAPEQVAASPEVAKDELVGRVAEELDRSEAAAKDRAAPDVHFRLHCLLLWESAFVEVTDMGFRECWFAALASFASSNIALRSSVVEGSTWAFLAVGRKGMPETAHSFEVTRNVWRQSPGSYRPSNTPCDIRSNWLCPVSVWSDLPWGIVHHHFWSPLNGALFMARDVLGNVKISENHVFDAYNGVRATLSATCRADAGCRAKANTGFEISGNLFERIRDNAVEPENHASVWLVKHNSFVDSYAVISTDGVSGNDLMVYGNVFALDDAPGARCTDDGWVGSRQFVARRGGGRWSPESAGADDASCGSHRMGTVIKLGGDDNDPSAPLLRSILFFNNSVRTRSPLFRGSPAPPITSYNNAVELIGCGTLGAVSCRQQPVPDPSCAGKDFWTADGGALFADCFPVLDGDGKAVPHRMRFNAYNRAPGPKLGDVDKDRISAPVEFRGAVPRGALERSEIDRIFATDATSPLARGGCVIRYAFGDLTCTGTRAPIGAMRPDGARFDLELPFRFPFSDVVRQAVKAERRR